MGIALNPQISFSQMAIFPILILPIHEHGRSLHLLKSSLIFFFRGLKFLSYISFTCLILVTPRYVMLFMCIVKGVISLISFSACLSFEQKKAIDLFEIILYPATLLNFFFNVRSFLVDVLRLLDYKIMLSAHSDILTSFFPICPSFVVLLLWLGFQVLY